MDLLTIGAFARLAHLSTKALRLYDDLRLLPPVHVDPDTGYRWYSPDQLGTARRVALLRRLDMPLARIRTLLDLPPGEAAAELTAYWAEREAEAAAQRELVVYLVDHLTGKRPAMHEVLIRDLPARTLLTIAEHLTVDRLSEFATPLFSRFGGPVVPKPDGVAGHPFLRYLGEVSADSDGPVEFCCPVEESAVADAVARFPEMTSTTEPAAREAYVQVTKSAMTSMLGFEPLRDWFVENRQSPAGPPRQIFLADPAAVGADDLVYELAVGLK